MTRRHWRCWAHRWGLLRSPSLSMTIPFGRDRDGLVLTLPWGPK